MPALVTIFSLLIFFLTWAISAIFAMAGVGAANTLVPVYYSLGISFSVAAAAGLLLNVFSLSSATFNNGRHSHIDWRLGTTFMIPAVIMAPIGAIIGINTPRRILLVVFALFLLYTIYNLLKGKRSTSTKLLSQRNGLLIGLSIGGLAGFMGGLLGVGGGMIILPVLTFLESDFKTVAGTAAYIALFSSASGFLSYLKILGAVNINLWLIILIGGALGGITGSYLMNRFNAQKIRYVIIAVVTIVALRLIYSILV